MNCLVHLYTCCSDRHASPYWTGVTTVCAWPDRGESVTELMLFMNCLVHLYTCCSDRHASPYWTGVTTGCAWPGRGESVTELMPFVNFPFHSYTCCSDRHASPYWTFIRRWISMDFTPSLLKKRMIESYSSLVRVASGAAIFTLLLRSRVTFLHRTATCRPLFKPSVSLLSTYRQSSCVANCYRNFKVFLWLFLAI